jgi:preprotein translocase subunit SecE
LQKPQGFLKLRKTGEHVNALLNYLREARAELTRVTWPTRAQATRWTIAVIIFSVVFSAFVGGLDYVFSQILQKVILKG